MITDIEMNGTMRGAVEVFNLASRLRHGDALFAECVRTFPTRDLDARAWLHRLSVEAQRVQVPHNPKTTATVTYITHVPATSRPHVRTERAKAPYPECYGYRPQRAPWQALCAYEFMMFWHCEALVAPSVYENNGEVARTQWTEAGEREYETYLAEQRKRIMGVPWKHVVLRPGDHYVVVPCPSGSYDTFPDVRVLQ